MPLSHHPTDPVPAWAREAVFYHIYPLGFFGAPPHNNHHTPPTPRLADLRRWYDHLSGLGVTVIYFGPLFESGSHGYDTVDYFSVDRRLGDNALLKQIVGELHGRGIRVILDGVFHHTGRDFFAFRDLREHGRESPYAGWYHIDWGGSSHYNDGFGYASWEGHQSLPRLNLDNPEVRRYAFEVARMWLSDVGVDGWRLDVAYAIDPGFWWEFRRACRAANPEAFLLGELIHGDYRRWVAPDLLDAATNYQLYPALWRALNDRNYAELKAVMERAVNPDFGLYRDIVLLNFLGNHDVTRFLSLLKDPRHIYPALIFLLAAPGIPCLYYGDEVGLTGHKEQGDGALRQPMPAPDAPWPDAERAIYRETARLAALRRAHPALIYGRYATLHAEGTALAFLRQHPREAAVIALNSAEKQTALTLPVGREGIPDGVAFRDVLNEDSQTFTVRGGMLALDPVWPYWGRILTAAL